MAGHKTSRLFVLNERELAFLQKLARVEYQFVTDDEQAARQNLKDKLNEVVLNPVQNRISVNVTAEELAFLATIVGANLSFITATERDARASLRDRLDHAARKSNP